MYNNKPLKRMLIMLITLVMVTFLAYYFVYDDVKYRNENYQTILHDLSLKNSKQDYLISTQKTLDLMDIDIGKINDSIIPKESEVEFIEGLESLADELGLTIEISSLLYDNSIKSASSTINILKIRAKTTGSWQGNYVFLSRLEALPYKIKINRYSLTNVSSDTISSTGKKISTRKVWEGAFEVDVLKYK